MSSKLAWSIEVVLGQPKLQKETLCVLGGGILPVLTEVQDPFLSYTTILHSVQASPEAIAHSYDLGAVHTHHKAACFLSLASLWLTGLSQDGPKAPAMCVQGGQVS